MKLLQHRLNDDNKILPMGVSLVISMMISVVAIADNSKDEFPPTPVGQQKASTASASVIASNPRVVLPVQNQFYPTQSMQAYRPYPYAYYYPQQQMPVYTPTTRQGGYYPRYQQPYVQNQGNSYPYFVAPSAYPRGNQQPAYNYPKMQAYQNPNRANTPLNNTGKTLYPMRKKIKKEKNAWGDERHIWPDFYTNFTGDAWDKMVNAPFDVGRMPGGWRAPSLSTPDPVTVSDAVANQVPPILEEMGNMTNFTN